MTETAKQESNEAWGRVLIAGGVDWLNLGKKDVKPEPGSESLSSPHILRALANVKIAKMFSGPSAMHAVAVDVHGNAHMLGRNYPSSVLGAAADAIPFSPYPAPTLPSSASVPIAVKILARDLPGARTTTSIAGKTASGSSSKDAGLDEPTRIVHAACARHHTLLVSQDGSVWACGSNPDGRLGVDVKGKG